MIVSRLIYAAKLLISFQTCKKSALKMQKHYADAWGVIVETTGSEGEVRCFTMQGQWKDRGLSPVLFEMGVFKNAKVGDVINFRGNLLRVSKFHKTCAHCFFRNLNCECIPCTAFGWWRYGYLWARQLLVGVFWLIVVFQGGFCPPFLFILLKILKILTTQNTQIGF